MATSTRNPRSETDLRLIDQTLQELLGKSCFQMAKFLTSQSYLQMSSVTNDRTERGLVSLEDFDLNLTKNESQQQFLP